MTITMASQGSLRPVFFRFMRPTARLARSGMIAAVFRGPVFDVLRDEVILFSETVDAIAIGGWIFFANRNNFDRSFEFLALIQERAAQTFDAITEHIAIDGVARLRAAATKDVNMMAKLASIQRKIDGHPKYTKALQTSRLLAFLDRNPHVDVDLVGKGAGRRLLFVGTPQRRWKILSSLMMIT